MKKQLLFLLVLFAFTLSYSQGVVQPPDLIICDTENNDGYEVFNLTSNNEVILQNYNAADYNVTFHLSMASAQDGTSVITNTANFVNFVNPQTIFVRVTQVADPNIFETTQFQLVVNSQPQIAPQTFYGCTDASGFGIVDLYEIHEQILSAGGLMPNETNITFHETYVDAVNVVNELLSPYQAIQPFQFVLYASVTQMNSTCAAIVPVEIFLNDCVMTGEPEGLSACIQNGEACFDLSQNDQPTLGTADPADYTITYHNSDADANSDINAIDTTSPFCISTAASWFNQMMFVRLENNTSGEFQTMMFYVSGQSVVAGTQNLQPLVQCDDDVNGTVIFDLTSMQSQLATSNTLTYYTTSGNAAEETNPITNPGAFSVTVTNPVMTLFIRENVEGSCDVLHSFQVSALSNCNIANMCASANSLCNSLGIPFANTVNGADAETGNDYGCLFSQPNPTWFYLPISTAGTINLKIQQSSNINFPTDNLDVDYIVYGPFANPVTPCTTGQLNASTILSCSYSVAPTEYPVIPNAQAGSFYLIMVTNYSNQAGYIKITEVESSQGEIDCTGLSLNAFLDSNNNGVKEVSEPFFPLGQFDYELNDDSNIHNVTSPTGKYNIYDLNPNNSYDFGYTIDPAYAANYSLSTSSYTDISVVAGGGMQDFYFPVVVTDTYDDLAIAIIPNEQPRPGFHYVNTIIYTNLGSQAVASGTVTFTKDPAVTIVGNSETSAVSNATGFTFNFANLQPFEAREISVTMQVPNIPIVALGDLLTNTAQIEPLTGDVVPANNISVAAQVIIGSYDPNDKVEARGGQILISDFDSQDYLYYTVRFENTGTASAINVRILDVLDSSLDASSVRMVASSHNYVLDRVDNQLTWTFDDILLPSTSQNPDAAKGFVQFRVKPNPGFAVGDIIPNTASIYFDFNPAIVTNTFETEFVSALATAEFEAGSFVFWPNPASNTVSVHVSDATSISSIAVYDMLGKKMLSSKSASGTNTEVLNVSAISTGIYFIEVITSDNAQSIRKLIIE